jgi:RNA polymerase sigma factor (sigma-70 family)
VAEIHSKFFNLTFSNFLLVRFGVEGVTTLTYSHFLSSMPPEYTEEGRWFAENLQPHEAMLRAWLHSRYPSGVDVDDVIQEAYMKVLKAREMDSVNAPKAFLFATARNLALNVVRYAKVRGEDIATNIDDCEIVDERAGVHETVARNQELEVLTKAIQSLPDRCRQIFTLRKVYGMSQRDIAKKLNLSARTVNAQISIGVNKCADYVGRFCETGKL